jgi:hypothetical protein
MGGFMKPTGVRGILEHHRYGINPCGYPNEYDFNRGFEFGYGACLLKNNAAADISNAIIAKKELEIAELKKRQIFTGSAEAFLGFTFSEQQLIGRIKELEQELARVREGER